MIRGIYIEKDRKIYFNDLFFNILTKWKKILIVSLIASLIFTAYSYVKNQNVEPLNEKEQLDNKVRIAAGDLTKAERQEIKQLEQLYQIVYEKNKDIISMSDKQNLMKLSASKMYNINMVYQIDNRSVYDVCALLNSKILDQKWQKSVLNSSGLNNEFSNIRDFISITPSDAINDNNMTKADIVCFVVDVISSDTSSVEKIADEVDSLIKKTVPETSRLSRAKCKCYSQRLFEKQYNILSEVTELNSSWREIINSYSKEQKNYYYARINADRYVEKDDEELDTDQDNDLFDWESCLTGFLAGAIIAICFFVYKYCSQSTLYCAKEIQDYFLLPVITTINKNQSQKHRNKNKNKKNDYGKCIDLICANIKLAFNKNNINSMCILGSYNSKFYEKVQEDILARLRGYNIYAGTSLLADPESIKMIEKADEVVLIESVNKSQISDMESEISICKRYDVKIAGVVVIK